MQRRLSITLTLLTLVTLFAACGGAGTSDNSDGLIPEQLADVENDLLSLINAERVDTGLPKLVRDPGLDLIELWYGNEMAQEHHLGHIDRNGRGAEERARYYGGDETVRCSEIAQWWGGSPSGSVHYEGYKASPEHHSAYLEEGIYDLGPTKHAGVVALRATGPSGTQYEGSDGSYTAVLLCDMPLSLAIDPFSEE